ncbi:ester cyclase [Chitinophaga qingshengii]|uniref:Ester cyclase n=1 Tax=Chitinophaga qingshengii TaxID=1569794 RepID=A0ABR7TR48_9BACT|nr:ester cyclase [Chitinophaga qingshengii]MBC9932960.1 ester cyclase [Chitinophaga qingshengii]
MTNKDIAKKYFDSINSNNFDAISEWLAAGHLFYNPVTDAPLNTPGHLGMMQKRAAAFDGTYILEQVLAEGNYVTLKGRWEGTHKGEFNGIPATGKQVTFPWIDLLEIKEGKIATEHFAFNPASIVAQIKTV